MEQNNKEFMEWFENLDFVCKRIEWFRELETRADFCDKTNGIFGFWKDYPEDHFHVAADPGYFHMDTIFVDHRQTSFDGTPYFNKPVSQDEKAFLVDTLNMMSDVYVSLKPHFGKKVS